jgi:hypothetical protein
MIAMDSNDDAYIASVLSYIRNDFGNNGTFVTPEYVSNVRKETAGRKNPYTFEELMGETPRPLTYQDNWIVKASSTAIEGVGSTKDPSYAFSFKGWKTESAQGPGMWFMVQLPAPQTLTEIQFDAGKEGFPISYAVFLSSDGNSWTKVGQEQGKPGLNTMAWKPQGKSGFLKIEANSKGEQAWSMKKLVLFAR